MKTLLSSLRSSFWICSALILLLPSVRAANYYINNSAGGGGNNSNNGTSTSTPWLDFGAVTSHGAFTSGDTINLAKGCTWTTQLSLTGSGISGSPITVTSYGTGNAPKIIRTSAPADLCLLVTDGSYWTIQNLELAQAGRGVTFQFSTGTFGNQGDTVQNNYLHDIARFPIYFLAGTTFPGSSQWICKDILVQGNTIATSTFTAFYFAESDASTPPVRANTPYAFQNVTIRNNYINNCYFQSPLVSMTNGLMYDNWINNVGGNGGTTQPGGLTGFFNWACDTFTYANNYMNFVPNTASTDKTMIDLEAYNQNINIFGNYIAHTAGPALEILQINDGAQTDDFEQNIVVDGNTFAYNSNPGYSTFGLCVLAVDANYGTAKVTGYLEHNFYLEPSGFATTFGFIPAGTTLTNFNDTGHTIDNNSANHVFNAPNDFSGTEGANGWSYTSTSSGSPANLTFATGNVFQGSAVSGTWSDSSGGAVTQFDMTASINSSAWVYRKWTAPAAGTVSIRGRVFKALTGGGTLRVAVTAKGAFVWPTPGVSTPQSLGASDQSGYDTSADSITVAAGDVVAFALNNNSGNTANAVVSWAPSIIYTSGGIDPGNQLQNPNFDYGYLTGWTGQAGTLALDTSSPHSGTYDCHVSGRSQVWGTAIQDVTDLLLANGQGYYDFSAWAKLATGSDTAIVYLVINDSAGTHYPQSSPVTLSTTYAQMAAHVNVTWTSTLTSAYLEVQTHASLADLYEDDFSLMRSP